MTTLNTKENWQLYCQKELKQLTPLLAKYGFVLDIDQPHLKGERFLMQAATTAGGRKLILFGCDKQGKKVVIKATRDTSGQEELKHERHCREVLKKLKFAAETFHTPPEVAWLEVDGFIISINSYIDQVSTFLERPLAEQFDIALKAFKAQEGTHATTYSHKKLITGVYDERTSYTYLENFNKFITEIKKDLPDKQNLHTLLEDTLSCLTKNQRTIEQYTGFLTHTDFVPHNVRIDENGTLYLLDHSSITFGNKHEGWARFINFMTLYNPELATALTKYVADNRAEEEQLSLQLMRCYRLGELIWYYTNKLPYSEGNLKILNQIRIDFWAAILNHVLNKKPIPTSLIVDYQNKRDSLRSNDEKERQKNLH